MAAPTVSVAATTTGAIELGRMCRTMIRESLTPRQRAASTKSCSFSERNKERTMRATLIQLRKPMARMMVRMEGPKKTDRAMIKKMPGMLSMTSVKRMMRESVNPPK